MNKFLRVYYNVPGSVQDRSATINFSSLDFMFVEPDGASNWLVRGVSGNLAGTSSGASFIVAFGFTSEASAINAMEKIAQSVNPTDLY